MEACDWLEVPRGPEEMRTWQMSTRVVRCPLFRLCMMRMRRLRLRCCGGRGFLSTSRAVFTESLSSFCVADMLAVGV